MKNNKVLGLALIGMLSVGAVGCGSNEVIYEEPQVQQEQIIDEDLNEKYKEEINQKDDLELAKSMIEKVVEEVGQQYNTKSKIITNEESNTVIQIVHVDSQTVQYAISTNNWNDMVDVWKNTSKIGKQAFEKARLSSHYCIMFADLNSSNDLESCECYLMIYDGVVTFNVAN